MAKDRMVAVSQDTGDLIDYWTRKKGFISKKAFVEDCVKTRIALYNHDYPLPDATINRINQLVTEIKNLKDEDALLRESFNNGLSVLLGLDDDESQE